jgi:hypothetical protein
MKHRKFNESQKAEIWGRLTSGESIPSVAKAYGCFPNAIRRMQVPDRRSETQSSNVSAERLRPGRARGDLSRLKGPQYWSVGRLHEVAAVNRPAEGAARPHRICVPLKPTRSATDGHRVHLSPGRRRHCRHRV